MAGNSTRVDDGGNEIPCFVSGTSIATARGEILIEDLKVGDAVVTRDNGIQKIRWIGSRRISPKQMEEHPHLKPILIEKGSLGNGLPDRHLMLSPNHRLLVNTDRVSLHYRDPEALISAKHLINPSRGVRPIAITGTTYFHLMFDQHQVILSNGAWTESFRPSDRSLKAVGNAQRTEIFELFPGLQGTEGRKNYAPARPDLKTDRAALVLFK
ncbi:MAG: Hint domain-containing protein [Litoreibacter sp.]|nr:Hint domain-containing protein [Litoreibacter sp.]